MFITWYKPREKGRKNIRIYEIIKFIDKVIVNLFITSLNRKIKNPVKIEINKTLKKLSFLLNLPHIPTVTNASITINIGFKISDK